MIRCNASNEWEIFKRHEEQSIRRAQEETKRILMQEIAKKKREPEMIFICSGNECLECPLEDCMRTDDGNSIKTFALKGVTR